MISKIVRRFIVKWRGICFKAYRRIYHANKYKSLEFLCNYAGISLSYLNQSAFQLKEKTITHVCTADSWHFPKGNICFVKNKDEAESSIKKGASVLIAEKDYGFPSIITDSPLAFYAKLCRYYRELIPQVSITAVTGSIGKTTTKNMIGTIYSDEWNTYFTDVNENTYTSIGFAVQHIPKSAEKVVQEVHEGTPGETIYLSEMIIPKTVVLTTIDKSHYERFCNPDLIVNEVCSITNHMKEGGQVIVNMDDFNRYDLLAGKKVITVSMHSKEADLYADAVMSDENGIRFDVVMKNSNTRYSVTFNNIYAVHNVGCALQAFAAAFMEGMEPQRIARALSTYRPQGDRQNVIRTASNITIYADCYNAVARSMKSAVDACDSLPVRGKRIAVLGDVQEAGAISVEMHREIIDYVYDSKFDILLTIGEKMETATKNVKGKGGLDVYNFDNLEDLQNKIRDTVCPNDLILFKASNSSNLRTCIHKVFPKEYHEMFRESQSNYKKYKENSLKY